MQTDKPGSLKDKFENFGAAPTGQLWDSIDASLHQENRKKRGAFWWWFGGIAAGLLLIISVYRIGYYAGKAESGADQNTALTLASQDNTTPSITDQKQLTEDGFPDQESVSVLNDAEEKAQPIDQHGLLTSQNNNHSAQTENGIVNEQNQSDNNYSTTQQVPVEQQNQNDVVTFAQTSDPVEHAMIPDFDVTLMPGATVSGFDNSQPDLFTMQAPALEKRKPDNRWELGFSVGTLAGYEATYQKVTTTTNNPQNLMDSPNADLEDSFTGSGFGPTVINNNVPDVVQASIKRPLSAEFSIARNLGRRWSLGSGIGLNYFRATSSYTSPAEVEMSADFLSLAIPVTVDFDYLKYRRFEASVGTGVINEFPFMMRSEKSFIAPAAAKETNQGVNSGYMGSVVFRTSFAYRLNEYWAIRLSPNARYYFHQSIESTVPVLKRNTWAGVSLGVTWTL